MASNDEETEFDYVEYAITKGTLHYKCDAYFIYSATLPTGKFSSICVFILLVILILAYVVFFVSVSL